MTLSMCKAALPPVYELPLSTVRPQYCLPRASQNYRRTTVVGNGPENLLSSITSLMLGITSEDALKFDQKVSLEHGFQHIALPYQSTTIPTHGTCSAPAFGMGNNTADEDCYYLG